MKNLKKLYLVGILLFFRCGESDSPAQEFTVTPSGEHVTFDTSAPQKKVMSGSKVSFTVVPEDGYIRSKIVGGTCAKGKWKENVYKTGEITKNCTVIFSAAAPGSTSIVASVDALAMSVAGLTINGLPSGTKRSITVTNTGSQPTQPIHAIEIFSFPAGTTLSSNCHILQPGQSCTIDITPGATPSLVPGNTISTPIPLAIEAENTNTLGVNLYVLTYGSVYQGGYLFSIDESTSSNQSIGGKVAGWADNHAGVIWSSNGAGGGSGSTVLDNVPGVLDNSMTGIGSCDGKNDGLCNTALITAYYPTINTTYYAAGVCSALTDGGQTDWYLPAVCELGYDGTSDAGCASAPALQNIQTNLVDNGNIGSISGFYWSSTEVSSMPTNLAWWQRLGSPNYQADVGKTNQLQIRCARALN